MHKQEHHNKICFSSCLLYIMFNERDLHLLPIYLLFLFKFWCLYYPFLKTFLSSFFNQSRNSHQVWNLTAKKGLWCSPGPPPLCTVIKEVYKIPWKQPGNSCQEIHNFMLWIIVSAGVLVEEGFRVLSLSECSHLLRVELVAHTPQFMKITSIPHFIGH